MSLTIGVITSVAVAAILPALYLFAQYKIPVLNLKRKKGVIRNGPWSTRFATGSEKMSLKYRAMVAIYGLWALRSTEAVYFSAYTDSDGNKLNRQSRYRIEGKDLDARSWSITVYKNNQFIPNAQYRYCYSMTNLERESDGSWKVILSADEQTGNWIPLGNDDGPIAVTLRFYNPGQSVYQHPETNKLPRIIKED